MPPHAARDVATRRTARSDAGCAVANLMVVRLAGDDGLTLGEIRQLVTEFGESLSSSFPFIDQKSGCLTSLLPKKNQG